MKFLTDASAVRFADTLGKPFLALPKLPKGFVNFLVMIIPWLSLLIGVLALLSTLVLLPALFTVDSSIAQYSGESAMAEWNMLDIVPSFFMTLLVGVLYLMAFNPLRKLQRVGWMYLFWGNMLGVLNIVWYAVVLQSVQLSSVLGLIISMYVMYNLRSSYTK